jgi:hypothetical protein
MRHEAYDWFREHTFGRFVRVRVALNDSSQQDSNEASPPPTDTTMLPLDSNAELRRDFALERYRFIQQQIHVVNENLYRFLTIYQGLMTALVGAEVLLFVNHKQWSISVRAFRDGVLGLLVLESAVAAFTVLLIVIGLFSWLDYRNEECDLADQIMGKGFRARPNTRNMFRWYETYVILFVLITLAISWILAASFILPSGG